MDHRGQGKLISSDVGLMRGEKDIIGQSDEGNDEKNGDGVSHFSEVTCVRFVS